MVYGNIIGVMPKNISAFINDADYLIKSEIITKNNTVTSTNVDYAEVGKWADGNEQNENRIGYFVAVDNLSAGTTMVKATSTMDIRGVTVEAPAFSGGLTPDKVDSDGNLLPQYDYVAVMGLVSVIDDGTCVINERCMSNDEGIATPSINNLGYQVIDRIDDTHILIAVEPSADMLVRIKEDVEGLNKGKVDKEDGKGLSTNDLTNTLKSNYDTAYTHSQSAHLTIGATADTAAAGNHNHDDRYYTETEIDQKLAKKSDNHEHPYINVNQKGASSGVAELDENGKVPSSQLPSYVDDVVEGYYYDSKFYKTKEESLDSTEDSVVYIYSDEITSEADKIYIDVATNTTYRWSGTIYVKTASDLSLGETSSTAYRGDRGKIAYEHTLIAHARTDATKVEKSDTNGNIKINDTETTVYTHPGSGTNPHGTTASDIGLGNVGNFKAVSTVENQNLSETEKTAARANIGAGTSSFSGSYIDLTDKPTIPDAYELPTGSADTKGGFKVGFRLTVTGDVLSATGGGTADSVEWNNVQNKPTEFTPAKHTHTASEVGALPSSTVIPSKTSQLTNDSGFITGYTETDPTVPAWAKQSAKPTYTASEVGARPSTWTPSKSDIGLGNVDNVKQYSASNPPPYPVTSVNGQTGEVTIDTSSIIEQNKGLQQKFWRGTQDEYDAIETKSDDTMYIVTDDSGSGGGTVGDMTKAIYDPQGKAQDIFNYVDTAIQTAIGNAIGGSY